MVEDRNRSQNQKLYELIDVIKLMKLRLEAKYGPSVKDLWGEEYREKRWPNG